MAPKAGKEEKMSADILSRVYFIAVVAILMALINWIWGLHVGPLPAKPKSRFGTNLGPEVICRCRQHNRENPRHDRVCGLKKLLSESYWGLNLGFLQINGPWCNYCFHDH